MSSRDPEAQSQRNRQRPAQPGSRNVGATPSGVQGDNPATAGPGSASGKNEVQSKTPENAAGHINPSAPEDSNITPGSGSEK